MDLILTRIVPADGWRAVYGLIDEQTGPYFLVEMVAVWAVARDKHKDGDELVGLASPVRGQPNFPCHYHANFLGYLHPSEDIESLRECLRLWSLEESARRKEAQRAAEEARQ